MSHIWKVYRIVIFLSNLMVFFIGSVQSCQQYVDVFPGFYTDSEINSFERDQKCKYFRPIFMLFRCALGQTLLCPTTVCPSYPPLKIAAVTNNRNFFNCILLFHYVKMNFSLSRFMPILQMTPYASGTNYLVVWWTSQTASNLSCLGQFLSKFTTVVNLLTCTVHRRHHHPKVREYFIGYALYPEEDAYLKKDHI